MSTSPKLHTGSSKGREVWCGSGALLAVLFLTGCASDGWRYMAPPKGTYSLSVDGAKMNPAGNAAFLTPGKGTVITHELRYGVPTGRTFESR